MTRMGGHYKRERDSPASLLWQRRQLAAGLCRRCTRRRMPGDPFYCHLHRVQVRRERRERARRVRAAGRSA